jgi:hypothetical protein
VNDYRLKYAQREHKARSKVAARWMLWLGLILIVLGGIAGYGAKQDAARALEVLARHDPDEVLHVPGRDPAKASELAEEVKTEALRVWVLNGVLAAAFIALAFWARKAPLPAAVTGLCLYLVLQLLVFLGDPTTLLKGLVFKIFFVLAMAKTISSALSERALLKAVGKQTEAGLAPAP